MFNKDYFNGKTSNYKFGYTTLKNKRFWNDRINRVLSIKNKGSLLDVGCAYGYFAKFMSEYFKVKGVDISEYAISKAKEQIGSKNAFVHNIADPLPFKKESFDIITAFDVIEHVPNTERVLNNLSKVMKRKAFLIMDMPLKCDNKLINIMLNDKDETHNNLLKYEKIHKLIKKTGFNVIKEKNILALFKGLLKIRTLKPNNFIELVIQKE